MGDALRSFMPIDVSFLSEYPDFFAFAMVMLLVVLLCVGVKESSILNNVFTVVNLITITIVIVAGSIKGELSRGHTSTATVRLSLYKCFEAFLYSLPFFYLYLRRERRRIHSVEAFVIVAAT